MHYKAIIPTFCFLHIRKKKMIRHFTCKIVIAESHIQETKEFELYAETILPSPALVYIQMKLLNMQIEEIFFFH